MKKLSSTLYIYYAVISVVLFTSLVTILNVIIITPSYAAVKKTDIRILIDISGSMKVNDPQNLRRPSLRLLIGLIPNGTKAGIWTFGKYVNMPVRLGIVNEQWKVLARSEANKIHSRGLYTNIESVLKKSSYDWNTKDATSNRHIILLTDGVVDISKNPTVNLESRNQIINKYLPKLKNAGVKIHTIALSKQADHELLKRMSVSTDGWYELIEDSSELNRVFLRLFEKSSSTNTVPLKDNVFGIDKSINDLTVLTFNKNIYSKAKLISPSKKIITQDNLPSSVKWFHEQSYDLITVNNPEQGEWYLDAPADKDNRVLVVTNLSLSVSEIPNNVILNQNIVVMAELFQKGKSIKNKEFLKLVKVHAIRKSLDQDDISFSLLDNGSGLDITKLDGIYSHSIRSPLRAGVFELEIIAQGPTFQRQRKFIVKVFNGLAEIDIENDSNSLMYKIEIKPHLGLLQDESIIISYEVSGNKPHKLLQDKDGHWKFDLAAENSGKIISFTITGLRQNNKSVEMQMERVLPIRLISDESNSVKPEKDDNIELEQTKIVTAEKKAKESEPQLEEPLNSKDNVHESEGSSWISVVIWVLALNLILALIVTVIYFVLKKIKVKSNAEDQENLQL